MHIIIETSGGIINQVYSDGPVIVDVLDHDDIGMGEEYAQEVEKMLSELIQENAVESYW